MPRTVDEKAKEVCQKLKLPEDGPAFSAIRLALKEQDRDTRHACAEAVLNCDEDVSGECIWKNEAHSACMNAVAV